MIMVIPQLSGNIKAKINTLSLTLLNLMLTLLRTRRSVGAIGKVVVRTVVVEIAVVSQ